MASAVSVNVLTAEEPTDWGGGSGLYDAFVEVAACRILSSKPFPRLPVGSLQVQTNTVLTALATVTTFATSIFSGVVFVVVVAIVPENSSNPVPL